VFDAAVPSTAGQAQDASTGVADSIPSGAGLSGLGGDVLSQALSDVGLSRPGAASTFVPAFAGATSGQGGGATSFNASSGAAGSASRKPALPQKVKRFLSGLPDLSHLYSSVIVS